MNRGRGSSEGLACYKSLVDSKRAKLARSRKDSRLFLLLVFVLTTSLLFTRAGDIAMFIALPSGFLLLMSLGSLPEPRLTVDEYKSLPGAVGNNGEHSCIRCGHRGIHRNTVYKTSTVRAACSNCEQPLWESRAN